MKLPNFLNFEAFTSVKRLMGIEKNTYGNMRNVEIPSSGLTRSALVALESQGIDVELAEVLENPDRTLGYKNKRVILYIRDVSNYGRSDSDPRFHVAYCRTLKEMRNNNRLHRYVVATKDTGEFSVRVNQSAELVERKLAVCQNCLDYLSYGSFELNWDEVLRRRAVSQFLIREFFDRFPKSLHHFLPKYDEKSAPENKYPPDFNQVSFEIRQSRGWRCESAECGIYLGSSEHRKYLHVHHLDGQKNNNSNDNLQALCLYCHAQQFQHQHMRSLPAYSVFLEIRREFLGR
jgi:hypothetical protein